MANHKSAEKRIRSSKKRSMGNKRVVQSLRKFEKTFKANLEEKKVDLLEENLKNLFKLADKAKKRGMLKLNTASRKKSRYSKKVSQILQKSL